MQTSENKSRMKALYAALAEGNARPFLEALHDDVLWTVIGTTRWSGTFRGKEAVLRELLRPLGERLALPHKVHLRRIVAEDDVVVTELRGESTTKEGVPYHNTYCCVHRLENGRIRELTEYSDTALMTSVLG